jgi:hypothetical protein
MFRLRNLRFYEGESSGSNTPPGGQAPQGAAPQAGGGQPTGQAPGGGNSGTQNTDAQDVASLPDWAKTLIGNLRNEQGSNRQKLSDLEKEVKAHKDEKLTEAEKLQQKAREAEEKAQSVEAQLKAERTMLTIEREARKLSIVDPEMAALAIQSRVEYDKDGKPTNVETLLKDLVKNKPFLVGDESGGGTPPSNPARTGSLTIEAIKAMTAQQIAALPEGEYQKVLAAAGQR